MSVPSIVVVERDGTLGTVSTAPELVAVVGTASAGTANSPTLVTKQSSLIAAFTSGELVEECAELIAQGVKCVAVKCSDVTNTTAINSALAAIKGSAHQVTRLYFTGDITSAIAAVLDTFCLDMLEDQNRRMMWYAPTPMFLTSPSDETVSAYITRMTTLANSFTTVFGSVVAGQLWTNSRVDGTAGYAPFSRFYVAQEMRLDLNENSAELRFPLKNCTVYDANGNLRSQVYVENLHGGLGDLKLVTPRLWAQRGQSPFVTAPYIHSPSGSDFRLTNHRAIMNLVRVVAFDNYSGQLNAPVQVGASDGKILEEDAVRLEKGVKAALETAIIGRGYASAISCTIDRDANLLSGADLEMSVDVTPLAFTESLKLSLGFKNPALDVV